LERAAMTIMLAKTYAALKAAGVSEEQAVAAAEELGHLNDQVGGLGHAMQEMHTDLKAELVGVRADFKSELGGVRADFKSELGNVRADFKSELGGVRADFKSELGGVRADFKSELGSVRADFKSELGSVRAEVAYLRGRFDVLIWAVGINAAATIAILGVLLRH
jgi:hypothetical protein